MGPCSTLWYFRPASLTCLVYSVVTESTLLSTALSRGVPVPLAGSTTCFYLYVGPLCGTGTVREVDPDVGGEWVAGLLGLNPVEGELGDELAEQPVGLHLGEQARVAVQGVGGGLEAVMGRLVHIYSQSPHFVCLNKLYKAERFDIFIVMAWHCLQAEPSWREAPAPATSLDGLGGHHRGGEAHSGPPASASFTNTALYMFPV